MLQTIEGPSLLSVILAEMGADWSKPSAQSPFFGLSLPKMDTLKHLLLSAEELRLLYLKLLKGSIESAIALSKLHRDLYQKLQAFLREIGLIKMLYIIVFYCLSLVTGKHHIHRLVGNQVWSIEDLAKALIFVVNNQGWEVRCALLSEPVSPSMGMKAQPLN